MESWLRLLCFFWVITNLFIHSDAKKERLESKHNSASKKANNIKHLQILEVAKSLNMVLDVSMKDSSNSQPYVGSPFTLPPFDSLSPNPLPNPNNPPFCVYPPPTGSTPTPAGPAWPSPTPPSPIGTEPSPPSIVPNPPYLTPEPPESVPSPFTYVPSPPYYEPSPPSGYIPSPPEYVPPPVGFAPGPPVFQPPVVYPPSTTRPPRSSGGGGGQSRLWCVVKPTVPDPIIQEAMNYACGSGADCEPIQPNGPCFNPNTLLAHASYAFNSYFQRTKVTGGTCDFGGTGMLVTVDPSSDGCHFVVG